MKTEGLLARVQRESGISGALETLTERLSVTDLTSLLLEVFARRAMKVSPKKLMEQYANDRFVRPSSADPRRIAAFNLAAFGLLADGYQPVELSPLAPLGTCASVATVHQNKIISTARSSEVLSDPTNVLALECAFRRKSGERSAPIRLAASVRATRASAYAPGTGRSAHFQLFSLVAGGRDLGSYRFETRHLREQLAFYLRLFQALPAQGFSFSRPRVSLTDLSQGVRASALEQEVLQPLRETFPEARFEWDPERKGGRGYYESVCFKLYVERPDGTEAEVGDGGDVPWTRALLSDAKERLIISGLAPERLVA